MAALLTTVLLPCSLALAAPPATVADTTAPSSTVADQAAAALRAASVPVVAPAAVTPTPPAAPVPTVPAQGVSAAASASVPAPAPTTAPATQLAPRSTTPAVSSSSAAGAAVASAAGLTQVAMVLVLIVAMIAAIAWLLRRLGMARAAGGSTIRVVSGVTLSNRERILVVEIADQWIVVGVTAGSINTLATMPRQDSATGIAGASGMTAPNGKNFALWLKQTIDKRNRAAASGGSTNG